MDNPSRSVAAFLESLQDAMQRLAQIHGHYVRRGTQPAKPFLVLSGRPFRVHEGAIVQRFHGSVALGLHVTGTDGREYELAVDILWDDERWTLQTEAWIDADAAGQEILRQLPQRTASDLDGCMRQLGEAVGDLLRFDDLVPGDTSQA